jgi:hypothetical protein
MHRTAWLCASSVLSGVYAGEEPGADGLNRANDTVVVEKSDAVALRDHECGPG